MISRRPIWVLSVAAVGLAGVLALASLPRVEPPIPTRVVNSVTSFATGHPEWAVLRDGRRDTTPLKMGHALHLNPDLIGGPLTCVSCHVTDQSGRYMLPIQFDTHCVGCHLGDLKTIRVAEGLVENIPTPHGSIPAALAAIDERLNALVAAYPEKFVIGAEPESAEPSPKRSKRPSDKKQALQIPVFSSKQERDEWINGRRAEAVARAMDACSFCHVAAADTPPDGEWSIAPPTIPARWLPRSQYSHAAHSMLSCDQCHAAGTSTATADILIPGIDSCRECHQPYNSGKGGAPTDCVLCHTYHAPAPIHEGALRIEDLRAGSASKTPQPGTAP